MTAVLMVSGSWPPQVCGVGDYTERLCRELEESAISVHRFSDEKLSSLYSSEIIRKIDVMDCDLVHIQYPTAGYGRSLTPRALAANVRSKPVVATLHEYSVFRWYRRAWFSSFAQQCAARIFTTDEERNLYQNRFPNRSGIDCTIEIASNIPVSASTARQSGKISYFGLIAPNKGIEQFLDLCEIAKSSASDLTFDLIGATPERHQGYANTIQQRASACGVHVALNLPANEAAERLAASTFAYLPFPDGASAKRGTLAAAIVNGLIVVTRHENITPEWIRSATVGADIPSEALRAILQLQDNFQQRSEILRQTGKAAARFRWDTIAQQHTDLYRKVLAASSDGKRNIAAAHSTPIAGYESQLAS